MRKALPLIAAIAALVIIIVVLLRPSEVIPTTETGEPLNVVASFYPIAEFARQVGGEEIRVATITPDGTEPHDYEPTAQEVAAVFAADVFLYNGGGIDAWADRIAKDVEKQGVIVVNVSNAVDTLPIEESEDDHGDEEATFDPHFWLSPAMATREVTLLGTTFAKADPTHAELFAANATSYNQKLEALAANYANGLASCENRTVVTSHSAFAYLAKAYDFTVLPIAGISPEEEPSAGRLAEIAEMAKALKIKYIYFETLASPKLAETIAKEVGATTLVFNPLEGLSADEIAEGKNYLTVMEENLKNLRTGMVCR